MLLRLAYLMVTTSFSFLRLLSRTDRDKEIEILVLRHQLMVLQRQVAEPVFTRADRFLLAGLLHRLPMDRLRHLVLLVRPDTVLRWHRDVLRRRHAAAGVPRGRGRPRTVRSIRLLARDFFMDLQDAGSTALFVIGDRDVKFTAAFDAVLAGARVRIVKSGVRISRMNSIMERWIQTCRRELLDRTLIWNDHHLRHALREFETFNNGHRLPRRRSSG